MVRGRAQLRRRFARVPEVLRAELAKQLETEAEGIVAAMRSLAPKQTGALAESIRWEPLGGAGLGSFVQRSFRGRAFLKTGVAIRAGGVPETSRQQQRGVTSSGRVRSGTFTTDLARLQEFGTVRMPANPFFFPVWRAFRRGARGRLRAAFRRAVKKA